MLIKLGIKEKLAIWFQVCQVEIEMKRIWGGFEIWINRNKFGDVNYFDQVSGNNYDMVMRLYLDPIPHYPFDEDLAADVILEKMLFGYFGDSNELISDKKSIIESYKQSEFWGNFILSPNGAESFDRQKLVYYGDETTVNFLYRYETSNSSSFSMLVSEMKLVAKQFIELYNQIISGNIKVELADKKNLY